MKYYVILLVTYNDDTKDKVAIYSYDTKDAALEGFYKHMSIYVNTANVATVNVETKDNYGALYRNDFWQPEEIAIDNE